MAVVADSLILMVFAQRLGASAATIGLIFASSAGYRQGQCGPV